MYGPLGAGNKKPPERGAPTACAVQSLASKLFAAAVAVFAPQMTGALKVAALLGVYGALAEFAAATTITGCRLDVDAFTGRAACGCLADDAADDGATDDAVDKLETSATRQGFYLDFAVGKLSVSAGLLGESTMTEGIRGECLT